MRRLTACIHPGDRGAIAMIVAILFMGGVLLGVAALTIDVGSINAERRTLQNGADAAAMSVARTCVGTKTCPDYGNTALVSLVNSNDAKDHHTKIARVDGKAAVCGVLKSDANLPACEPLKPGLSDCPTPQKLPAQYIRVYTQTQNSANSTDTILPPIFGQTVVGSYKGVTQQTCASVGIEPLGSSYKALPIVMAKCAYDTMLAMNPITATNPQGPFPLMPPYKQASQTAPELFPTQSGVSGATVAMNYSKYVMTIWSHVQNNTVVPAKCDASNSGLYLPGGFGWTTTVDPTHCSQDFLTDTGLLPVGSGTATPQSCKNNGTSFKSFVGTTTYIPIMTGETVDKNYYIIDGLAGFYIAGYHSPAASPNSYDGYASIPTFTIPKLTGNDDGFWGWFTDEFVPSGPGGSTDNPKGPTTLANIG